MELTFDQAIEILEITDISKVTLGDIPRVVKSAKKRWHPDKIIHFKDEEEIAKYTQNFQLIEPAAELLAAFLKGELRSGERFERRQQTRYEEPTDVIRRAAPDMQNSLRALWETIKSAKYKFSMQEVVISDGFNLKDLLTEDFKEDLAGLSVISFVYGVLIFGLLAAIGAMISPILGSILAFFCLVQLLACFLGFLPLSRFWLPEQIHPVMFWFIDLGLGVYNWAYRESTTASIWVQLLVQIPVLLSKAVKYIILFPAYEIAKLILAEKVVGVVKQKVPYYAGAADWYIKDLLNKAPLQMTDEELFDLSYLYSELSDVKSKI